jgi:hypothetical protein
MKLSRTDLIYSAILVVFSLALWLPSRYYPLFWDSTYVVKTASQIYDSNFAQLVSQEQGYAHPTLFPTLLALLWKLFGTQAIVGHYLTLPFLPLLLISSYFLIRNKTDSNLGFIGAAFIGFTPVVLAEYVNVYTDLPMAALVAASALLWTKQKYLLWALVYGAAILTKIPAIAVFPYFLLDAWQTKNKAAIKYAAAAPLLTVAGWLIYHRIISGWWLVYTESGHTLSISRSVSGVLTDWIQIIITIFLSQGRWAISAAAAISLVLLYLAKGKQSLQQIINNIYRELIVVASGALLFAATGEFGYRYAIFIYTFLYIAIFYIIHELVKQFGKNYKVIVGTLFAILFYFTTLWRPIQTPYETTVFTPPDDLGITDYIQVFRWLTSFVTLNSAENIIYYGGFPENVSLLEPKMGFISSPAPFKACDQYEYDPEIKQIIILHPFSPTVYPCYQIIQALQLEAITGHEVNGKWIDLYLASESATPAP